MATSGNRYVRNSVILAKIEVTYGTDPTPTGAANAILISNMTVNPLNAQNVSRDLVRGYLGGSEQLVGTAYVEVGFDVEVQSSGALGTAPAWGPLHRACGFAETITGGSRVEYNPISTAFESVTIYYYDDGVLHKVLGARGSFSVNLEVGARPVFSYRFIGIDGGITAAANATPTLTAWKAPAAVTDVNTADVLFGCTYATGALSGGTAYNTRGMTVDVGNAINFTPMVGLEIVDLSSRESTGGIQVDLTAANEVTFMTNVKANTTQSVGIVHGTTSGYKVLFYAPVVQLINPRLDDINGRRLIGFDMRMMPSAGNDELKIVAI